MAEAAAEWREEQLERRRQLGTATKRSQSSIVGAVAGMMNVEDGGRLREEAARRRERD